MAISVLMTTEGTYPYQSGGVSVWCNQLVQRLKDVQFHIFAIVPSPKQPLRFELPDNVVSCTPFPLWGTNLSGVQESRVSTYYRRALRTTEMAIEQHFLGPFVLLVRSILVPDAPSVDLAESMLALHRYFAEYDYASTMQSAQAWSAFLDGCSKWLPGESRLNLDEATACMRWLLRYLGILSVPYPSVDVVHSSIAGLAGVPGVLASLEHGTPYVLTEHGICFRELYLSLGKSGVSINCRRFLLGLNEAIVRMNYHYADLVTTLGDFNRAWQVRLGAHPAKIVTVANGVDPKKFFPQPERRRPQLTVLTLARIFPLKGIDVMLRAIGLLRDRIPQVKFRILGEVADQAYYQQCRAIIAKYDIGSMIEWGETSDPAGALAEAHLFCLPSISEGMPYSVLEAMLSGCVVVATDVGNVASVLAGKGVLVRPNDPSDLARRLLEVLDGPQAGQLRERLAAAALERARAHFTADVCTTNFRNIYKDLTACQTIRIA